MAPPGDTGVRRPVIDLTRETIANSSLAQRPVSRNHHGGDPCREIGSGSIEYCNLPRSLAAITHQIPRRAAPFKTPGRTVAPLNYHGNDFVRQGSGRLAQVKSTSRTPNLARGPADSQKRRAEYMDQDTDNDNSHSNSEGSINASRHGIKRIRTGQAKAAVHQRIPAEIDTSAPSLRKTSTQQQRTNTPARHTGYSKGDTPLATVSALASGHPRPATQQTSNHLDVRPQQAIGRITSLSCPFEIDDSSDDDDNDHQSIPARVPRVPDRSTDCSNAVPSIPELSAKQNSPGHSLQDNVEPAENIVKSNMPPQQILNPVLTTSVKDRDGDGAPTDQLYKAPFVQNNATTATVPQKDCLGNDTIENANINDTNHKDECLTHSSIRSSSQVATQGNQTLVDGLRATLTIGSAPLESTEDATSPGAQQPDLFASNPKESTTSVEQPQLPQVPWSLDPNRPKINDEINQIHGQAGDVRKVIGRATPYGFQFDRQKVDRQRGVETTSPEYEKPTEENETRLLNAKGPVAGLQSGSNVTLQGRNEANRTSSLDMNRHDVVQRKPGPSTLRPVSLAKLASSDTHRSTPPQKYRTPESIEPVAAARYTPGKTHGPVGTQNGNPLGFTGQVSQTKIATGKSKKISTVVQCQKPQTGADFDILYYGDKGVSPEIMCKFMAVRQKRQFKADYVRKRYQQLRGQEITSPNRSRPKANLTLEVTNGLRQISEWFGPRLEGSRPSNHPKRGSDQQSVTPASVVDVEGDETDHDEDESYAPEARPTIGGKTIPDDWLAAMQSRKVAYMEEESDSEMGLTYDYTAEPVQDDTIVGDSTYFIYTIMRKEWTHDEDEEYVDELTCSDHVSLKEANIAAYQEALRVHEDSVMLKSENRNFMLSSDVHAATGMHLYKVKVAAGYIQAWVERSVRNKITTPLPSGSTDFLPKSVWSVKIETQTPGGDGIFTDDPAYTVMEDHGDIYTTRDLANKEAGHKYLDMMPMPKYSNLDMLDFAKKQALEKLQARVKKFNELEECFFESFEAAGGKIVRIWVMERTICGPRN